MFEASNFTKQSIAECEFGGAAHEPAETYTMRLFSDTVDLGGDGTEITTGGYAEVEFDNDNVTFPFLNNGTSENAVVIQTDVFTDDSPAIKSVGFFDENGNLRYRKVYPDNAVFVLSGNVFRLDTGMLTFSLS